MGSPSQPRKVVLESDMLRFRFYDDGSIDRLGEVFLPPSSSSSLDPSGVSSKDVSNITLEPNSSSSDSQSNISARLYLPKTSQPNAKLAIVLYFHGGGFFTETPFSPHYHPYLNSLSSRLGVLGVSVHYRRAPEHRLPACYDDCHAALKWVFAHGSGDGGPEAWLNEHADLSRVFLMGDSAGANIAHHVAVRAGREGLPVEGVVLVHPFFWQRRNEAVDGGVMDRMCGIFLPDGESEKGGDHPWLNVVEAPGGLDGLGCRKVLVCVAEKDRLRQCGWEYWEALRRSSWEGRVEELWEDPEEGHVFHLFKPSGQRANAMMDRVSSFFNSGAALV